MDTDTSTRDGDMQPMTMKLAAGGAAFGAAASLGLNGVSTDEYTPSPAGKIALPTGLAVAGATFYGLKDITMFKGPHSSGKGLPITLGALAGAAAIQAATTIHT